MARNINLGFGSAGASGHVRVPWNYFKLTQAKIRSQKFMVAEVPILDAAGDGPPSSTYSGTPIQEVAHWEPVDGSQNFRPNNTLTTRHSRKVPASKVMSSVW